MSRNGARGQARGQPNPYLAKRSKSALRAIRAKWFPAPAIYGQLCARRGRVAYLAADVETASLADPIKLPDLDMLTNILKDLLLIFASRAPWSVWRAYFNTLLLLRGPIRAGVAKADLREFEALTRAGAFQTNWFGGNVPHWLYVIERFGLAGKPLDVLEIGSWEGASSLFILCALPLARLTCVDTWAGADEHQGTDALNAIERNFLANTAPHADRLTRFKGTSFAYFADCGAARFDLIYIDGSHHADDVLIDAIKGFEVLRLGGVLIFDDYLWRYYPRRADNPAAAINAFLRLKQGCFELALVNWQVVIRKTGGERQAG